LLPKNISTFFVIETQDQLKVLCEEDTLAKRGWFAPLLHLRQLYIFFKFYKQKIQTNHWLCTCYLSYRTKTSQYSFRQKGSNTFFLTLFKDFFEHFLLTLFSNTFFFKKPFYKQINITLFCG
jgi:hypothetical protein